MKILMVCLGNICRSPIAEGLMRRKIITYNLKAEVDSAGTGGWHAGEPPDPRMTKVALKKGTDIRNQRARKFTYNDFAEFDRIYVMDNSNYRDVMAMAKTTEDKRKVSLLLDVVFPNENMEVPDPYYGGDQGFEHVYSLVDTACEAIANKLKK